MTRKLAGFVVFAVILTLTAFAQTGNAAPTPTPTAAPAGATRIGIINIQQAIVASNEGQRDLEQLQKKFEPRQAELQKLNSEVEDLKKQLQTQGDKLNEETRLNLQKNLEAKQKTLQRNLEDAQNDAQQQQGELFNRIGQKMMGVLEKYAKSNGYSLIVDVSSPQSPVLWADLASTDVTKAIVDAYNAQSGVPAPARAAGTPPVKPGGGAASSPTVPKKPVTAPASTSAPATKPQH
ncbi:MAG: OmpH family outer membrane protein [Acidobacteria bacterium]|nr:OmpH family outer membrane protein [Acidobacteriaceae bacterium]MBV9609680.1 OmpH family outer membrane protein [Acidobacteriota bacterium]